MARAGTVPAELVCRVTPGVIQAGAFYDGAEVKVEGVAAPRSKVIVTVSGSDREERFNRQARFGPIWLNAGKVRISGAPSLFLRFSAGAPASLLTGECARSHYLDERSLTARIRLDPPFADRRTDARLRADCVALKKSQEVYRFDDGGVVMGEPRPDGVPYHAIFRWPKRAPPATYEVRVYEVVDGTITRETSVPLAVVRAGFPAWLARMAENNAPLYGIIAVLIAVLAGFTIDFITRHVFHSRRASVH
ncbi:MAG TPA: TIGR02186 family protein [Bryobacteraceae bacterium]|nr:TIGR02186 family protein [Bryobacteraceae bacterium]